MAPDPAAGVRALPAIGVDAGGTKIAAGLVAADGTLVERALFPTPNGSPAGRGDPRETEVLDALGDAVALMLDRAGPAGVAGIGVGLPGLVDRAAGEFIYGPNFPLRHTPVVAELRARTGHGVLLESDADAAAWGEHVHGAGVGCDDLLLVTLGTGIGGGVVSGGALWRGAHGHAGEFGHVTVDPTGPPCACGGRGHWEAFASGTALDRSAQAAAATPAGGRLRSLAGGDAAACTAAHVVTAALAGDHVAVSLLDAYAEWVAVGLAGLVQCFDPARIVVGGGVVAAGAALFDPLAVHLARLSSGYRFRPRVDVVPAGLGPWAGTVGAAALAAVG